MRELHAALETRRQTQSEPANQDRPWMLAKARNRQPWSADELDRLCHMLTMGKPIREIAQAFGRTQEAVRTKAYQLDRMTGPSL